MLRAINPQGMAGTRTLWSLNDSICDQRAMINVALNEYEQQRERRTKENKAKAREIPGSN